MVDAKKVYAELRQPLLRSGAILGVLLILMIAAGGFNAHMSKAHKAAEQTLQGLVQDYRTAVGSEQILRTETERFVSLQAQGIVGAEPRLRWIEDVRETAALTGVVAISYELEPRAPFQGTMNTGSYQLFASKMRLKLELRHEGDLLRFLDQLDDRRSGLFDLSACALQKSKDENELHLHGSNVNAECELRWYSLDSADATLTEEAQ
jgi:hypothetical protein